MLECVVNISEGRDLRVVEEIASVCLDHLLDLHSDADHNRSVLTLAGPRIEEAVRAVARRSVDLIDITHHSGAHPRFGSIDVVPFVPLGPDARPMPARSDLSAATAARDSFASWAAQELGLPCFVYGPDRSLPELRRRAFGDLAPDFGPPDPHPSAGACAVGSRHALVAYNLWLATTDVNVAKQIAGQLRSPEVRAMGIDVGTATQVSCNLVTPDLVGPSYVFNAVERAAQSAGTRIVRGELVGLVPQSVLGATPSSRWEELDLEPSRTIEARFEEVGAVRRQ